MRIPHLPKGNESRPSAGLYHRQTYDPQYLALAAFAIFPLFVLRLPGVHSDDNRARGERGEFNTDDERDDGNDYEDFEGEVSHYR